MSYMGDPYQTRLYFIIYIIILASKKDQVPLHFSKKLRTLFVREIYVKGQVSPQK